MEVVRLTAIGRGLHSKRDNGSLVACHSRASRDMVAELEVERW